MQHNNIVWPRVLQICDQKLHAHILELLVQLPCGYRRVSILYLAPLWMGT
jgi:hypothetical protein